MEPRSADAGAPHASGCIPKNGPRRAMAIRMTTDVGELRRQARESDAAGSWKNAEDVEASEKLIEDVPSSAL